MSDVQNIAITSAQTVPQPKPHTTYTIQGESSFRKPPRYREWSMSMCIRTSAEPSLHAHSLMDCRAAV